MGCGHERPLTDSHALAAWTRHGAAGLASCAANTHTTDDRPRSCTTISVDAGAG